MIKDELLLGLKFILNAKMLTLSTNVWKLNVLILICEMKKYLIALLWKLLYDDMVITPPRPILVE